MVFKLQIGRLKEKTERINNAIQYIPHTKPNFALALHKPAKHETLNAFISDEKYSDYEANYEVILRWNPKFWPNRKSEYQRLGFKGPMKMSEAIVAIQATADLLGRVARPHKETRLLPVEIHAIYRQGAFQDWYGENKYIYGNEFIKKTLASIQADNEAGKDKTNRGVDLTVMKVRS